MKSNHALHELALPVFKGRIAEPCGARQAELTLPSPDPASAVVQPDLRVDRRPPNTQGPRAAKPWDKRAETRQERFRERMLNCETASISEHELLELVLSRVLSAEDAARLVSVLMTELGDYNRIISASPGRLRAIAKMPDAAICELKLIEASAHRLARARILNRPVISGWNALLDYCHTAMAHQPTERIRVLYMDRKNTLIADEEQGRGTVNHAPIYPREVVRRALELEASALILVHNHPSGDPTPSQADIETTDRIGLALSTVDITLHDHLILGHGCEISFRARGLL